jgi:uncharacterized protein (DUF924 family)
MKGRPRHPSLLNQRRAADRTMPGDRRNTADAKGSCMRIVAASEIIQFWFSPAQKARWYAKQDDFDAEIRRRFLATYEAAHAGRLEEWRKAPDSLLSLIILLDQFPRNMFRGLARAFASDAQAVNLTNEGIENGFDRRLSAPQLGFFYMPLMHSESIDDQNLLIKLGHGENRYARQHREIIARFGRFPHRNEVLGRENTPEEALYLSEPHPIF